MLTAVKEALGTKIFEHTGSSGGGCISSGAGYKTDTGQVFVKWNSGKNALQMFEGEKEGLLAILNTNTVRCPKPICVVPLNDKGSAALVMSNMLMKPLSSNSIQQAKLGEQIALLHQTNGIRLRRFERNESRIHKQNEGEEGQRHEDEGNSSTEDDEDVIGEPVFKFGFHVPTSCGYHSLNNNWNHNWSGFYIKQRLQPLVDTMIRSNGDRELIYTWSVCLRQIDTILSTTTKNCYPALLHGDLWTGNVGSIDGEPIIFDPGVFYGHSEFDFGIGHMFGGFTHHFFDSYHSIIPRDPGFDRRRPVYELFHHLNHWNHFGSNFRGSTLKIMKKIINEDPVDR